MSMNYADFDYAVGQHLSGLLDAFWENEEERPALYRPDEVKECTLLPEHFVKYNIDNLGSAPISIGNRATVIQRQRALLTVEIWAKQGRFEKEILATKSFFQFHLLGATVNLIGLEGQAFWRIENMRTPPGVVEGDYFVSDLYIETTYDIVAGELPRVRNN